MCLFTLGRQRSSCPKEVQGVWEQPQTDVEIVHLRQGYYYSTRNKHWGWNPSAGVGVCVERAMLSSRVESERRSSFSFFFSICLSICLSPTTRKISLFGFGCLKAFAKCFTICRVWFVSKKPTLRTRFYVTKMCLFLFKSLRREIISCPLWKERFQSKENSPYSKIYKQLFEMDAKSNSKREVFLAEVLS